MEAKSRIAEMWASVTDWLNEQEWFQQIKQKWDELDPQSRLYLQLSGAGGGVLLIGFVVLSFMWGVHRTHSELVDKSELVSLLESANTELRTLHEQTSAISAPQNGAQPEPWADYLTNVAASAGIPKANLTVSDSKTGATTELTKETLFDITMKKINIRQAIHYAQNLEGGSRPVKLRNLVIDTQPDMSGYLDVTLSVSTFAMVQK